MFALGSRSGISQSTAPAPCRGAVREGRVIEVLMGQGPVIGRGLGSLGTLTWDFFRGSGAELLM